VPVALGATERIAPEASAKDPSGEGEKRPRDPDRTGRMRVEDDDVLDGGETETPSTSA
jgi:hypothetical protein